MYINHLEGAAAASEPSLSLQHPKYLNKLKIDMAKNTLPVAMQGQALIEAKANELRLK